MYEQSHCPPFLTLLQRPIIFIAHSLGGIILKQVSHLVWIDAVLNLVGPRDRPNRGARQPEGSLADFNVCGDVLRDASFGRRRHPLGSNTESSDVHLHEDQQPNSSASEGEL